MECVPKLQGSTLGKQGSLGWGPAHPGQAQEHSMALSFPKVALGHWSQPHEEREPRSEPKEVSPDRCGGRGHSQLCHSPGRAPAPAPELRRGRAGCVGSWQGWVQSQPPYFPTVFLFLCGPGKQPCILHSP